jgi:hypothetical protein
VWHHVNILPDEHVTHNQPEPEEDNMTLAELCDLLRALPESEADPEMIAQQYAAIAEDAETGESLSDSSIIELVTTDNKQSSPQAVTEQEHEVDAEPAPPPTTLKQARQGLLTALAFFEEREPNKCQPSE